MATDVATPKPADLIDWAAIREVDLKQITHGSKNPRTVIDLDLQKQLTASVQQQGILQPIRREVTVLCFPSDIPEFFEVDVSALGINEALHLNQLHVPPQMFLFSEPTAVGPGRAAVNMPREDRLAHAGPAFLGG